MSESIQSESIQAQPASNPKALIITSLITAATTIAVSFGVPLLRGQAQTVSPPPVMSVNAPVIKETPAPAPVKMQIITGTVLSKDGKNPKKGIDVFLVPTGRLTGQTNSKGEFMLPDIPPGEYMIVVQGANVMSDFTYLIRERNKADLADALIEYNIREKGEH